MSTDAASLRQAILTSVPADPFQTSDPDPRLVYIPKTHIRALDPDNMLVVGARGTGKSFWWHALLSEKSRATLTPQTPSMQRFKLKVSAGWNEQASPFFPDKDILRALRSTDLETRLIWKTVLLYQISNELPALKNWRARTEWVVSNPEDVAEKLRTTDNKLATTGSRHLVLFDALDRTADAWADRRALLKGLLQLVLELRSTRAIRAKIFVRPDMIQDAETLAFVDSSKVIGTRVDLTWPRLELYGLLWQYMGNADVGAEDFRSLVPGWRKEVDVYRMPESLRSDESVQRRIFAVLAGKAMGTDERRGLPYTWIPTHLGDASAIATPRSFLAALRKAAEDSDRIMTRALDWRAIHSGVRRASEIRVTELAEDFPWTKPAMEALEGLNVPCERKELTARWTQKNVMKAIESEPEGRVNKGAKAGIQGLLDDLVDVGVLELRPDGRYNIPDVYRVGFGLKRRGGVRPVS